MCRRFAGNAGRAHFIDRFRGLCRRRCQGRDDEKAVSGRRPRMYITDRTRCLADRKACLFWFARMVGRSAKRSILRCYALGGPRGGRHWWVEVVRTGLPFRAPGAALGPLYTLDRAERGAGAFSVPMLGRAMRLFDLMSI